MTSLWIVEVDLGGVNYQPLGYCHSKDQAERQANYFRPMQGLSGKTIRVRESGKPANEQCADQPEAK